VSYEEWQAAWQATLAVNLTGAANVTWCAIQHSISTEPHTCGLRAKESRWVLCGRVSSMRAPARVSGW
jgi:NAD(P)-dependent dehydrogenase (short-subunit alcohol dehydrogenase family)